MATLFEAYVTNAGKYSEGQLVGETLKFPTTAQEVEALLKRIGVDGVRYQEIFITSFDGDVLGLYDHLSEYENLDELNHLACLLSEVDVANLYKWMFKTACAILILSNTFNIVMAVFDVSQSVIAQAGGLIQGSTDVSADMLAELETSLEAMDLGPLLGLWLQSALIGFTMKAMGIIIFVLVYGRMLEIYSASRSAACNPQAVRGHFGNPALASR